MSVRSLSVSLAVNQAARTGSSLFVLLVISLALCLTSFQPAQAQLTDTILYSFSSPSDGQNPICTLTRGKDGNYYGTTCQGGAYGYGTLFQVSPAGVLTVLHHFTNGADGACPQGGVVFDSKGNLYGSATSRANSNWYINDSSGVLYEYTPATGVYTVLHTFSLPQNGSAAGGSPLLIGNNLYGVGHYAGQYGNGTLFKLTLPTATSGVKYKDLHQFTPQEGMPAYTTLIKGSDGYLYGTTTNSDGGAYGFGTVYKLSPATGALTILHSFSGPDGIYPWAGVIEGRDGMLYGTTNYGGSSYNGTNLYSSGGTVFQISKDGSVFSTLHSFTATDGANPIASVTEGSDGMLYGVTYYGGPGDDGVTSNGYGVVFKISKDGSLFTDLYSFINDGTDGTNPASGVIEGLDGNLYGTTFSGGASNAGTLFILPIQLPLIKSFGPNTGSASSGTVVTLHGTNLINATLTIGGVSQNVISDTAATIKFKLSSSTPTGSYSLIVTTPNGTDTSAKLFTVNP